MEMFSHYRERGSMLTIFLHLKVTRDPGAGPIKTRNWEWFSISRNQLFHLILSLLCSARDGSQRFTHAQWAYMLGYTYLGLNPVCLALLMNWRDPSIPVERILLLEGNCTKGLVTQSTVHKPCGPASWTLPSLAGMMRSVSTKPIGTRGWLSTLQTSLVRTLDLKVKLFLAPSSVDAVILLMYNAQWPHS